MVHCDPTASIGSRVRFLGSAYVGPYCLLGSPCFQHADWRPEDFIAPTCAPTILGDGARLLGHTVICAGTEIGKRLRCDYHCFIGENCKIEDDVVVEYGARIYTRVSIGSKTAISGFVCNDSVIGRNCVIQGALVHARTKPGIEAAPLIEDDCLVGAGAIIVGGVLIRRGSFIAAGAVVTHDTDEDFLYAGVPARRIKRKKWY